jgi:hypothetical protein
MKISETLENLFNRVHLSFAEEVLGQSYHAIGSRGRPSRSPLGVFIVSLLSVQRFFEFNSPFQGNESI